MGTVRYINYFHGCASGKITCQEYFVIINKQNL